MEKPVLVIMAAGMGSRYGGCKQIDPVGPHGEIILDYSLFDAMRAGFERAVFIISRRIETDFMEAVGSRVQKYMDAEFVLQEQTALLPEGATVPEGRVKPWGTGHAILCCRDAVKSPFAVINADDYYGAGAFRVLFDRLQRSRDLPGCFDYSMVGFRLGNTLTEHGTVSRGICETDAAGRLVNVTERTKVAKRPDGPAYSEDGGNTWIPLPEDTPVSMNMWGFTPSIFEELARSFPNFLKNAVPKDPLKSEFYIPMEAGRLLREGRCTVDVLSSPDRWYGVTYKEDKPAVAAAMARLTQEGIYPDEKLFK